jgi:hypothetical protein
MSRSFGCDRMSSLRRVPTYGSLPYPTHCWIVRADALLFENLKVDEEYLRTMRRDLDWLLPRVRALEPIAKKGAAVRIFRWWSRTRARRNWTFLRGYLDGYLEASKSWKRHQSLFDSPEH